MRMNTTSHNTNQNNGPSKAMFLFEYKKSYYHQGLRKLSHNIDLMAEEAWEIYKKKQQPLNLENKRREREH